MARRTKTQIKNMLKSIKSKAGHLFLVGLMSSGDMATIERMMDKYLRKL